jgi:tetratricopeptide (TPR) repeat protein
VIAAPIQTKQQRLARHYLARLSEASSMYRRGSEDSVYGLKSIETDWAQIQQFQAWAAAHADQSSEAAVLCIAYPIEAGELVDLMLSPQEHRAWREAALQVAERLPDPRAELLHLLALSDIYERFDEYGAALDYARRALALAQGFGDVALIAQGLMTLGVVLMRQGQYEEADGCFEGALALYREFNDTKGVARSLMRLGSIKQLREQNQAGQVYYEEALRLYRTMGDRRGVADALNMLGEQELFRTEADTAEVYFEEAMQIRRQMNDQRGIATALSNFGRIAVLRGDYAAAQMYIEQSLQLLRELGSLKGINANLLLLSGASILKGDYAVARQYAEETLEHSRRINNMVGLVQSLVYIAYSCLGLYEPEPARHALLEGLQTVQRLGTSFLKPELVAGAGILKMQNGDFEGGARLFGLVQNQPNTHVTTQKFILPPLLKMLGKAMGREALTALLEQGKALDFEATAAQLMNEFEG